MNENLNTPPISKDTTLQSPTDLPKTTSSHRLKDETSQLLTNWKILELEKRLVSTETHFEQRISELTTLLVKLFSRNKGSDSEEEEKSDSEGTRSNLVRNFEAGDALVRRYYLKWAAQLPSLEGITRVSAYRRLTRFKNIIIDHNLPPQYVLEFLQRPANSGSRILITEFYHTLEINLFLSWIALEKDLEKLPKTPELLDCLQESILYWKQDASVSEGVGSLIDIVDTFVNLGSHINWHLLFSFFATNFFKLIHKALAFTNLRVSFLEFEPKLRSTLELNLKSDIYYNFWSQFSECLRNASLNSAISEERALFFYTENPKRSVNLSDLIYQSMV